MEKSIKILKIYKNTFRVNVYTVKPFRAIGLIDADIQYNYGIERVRLAFYRSSGTNGGKIRGLWYPLVGIKVNMGQFTEFSNMVNKIMEILLLEGCRLAEPGEFTKRAFLNGSKANFLL